jgi:DeoR family fructose operon transcriptional repressor
MASADIGIDLGTASILVYVKGKGVVLKEPSIVAYDKDLEKIVEIGEEARLMLGRTPGNIIAIRPLRHGVVSDYTTTEKMLKYINNHEAVYVTNAVSHAMKLASIGCTVFILGGEFKYATEAIVGEEAIASLSKYNFTKGFFGTNGITVKNGFTTPEIKEALIKRQAMASCKQCYVLADHSKFGEISSVSFGGVDEATIITDKTDDNLKRTYKNLVEVVQ